MKDRMVPSRLVLLAGGAVLAMALVLRLPQLTAIYQWDEVDYVRAAALGVRANYLSEHTMPPAVFVHRGLVKWLHLGDEMIRLPDGYDPSRDPVALAHSHPPLSLYPVTAALRLFGEHEWSARLPALLASLLTLVALGFTARAAFGPSGEATAVWAAGALALMPAHVQSSHVVSMHPLSTLLLVTALGCWFRFRAARRWGWFYGMAALLALSLLALETVPALLGFAGLVACDRDVVRVERRQFHGSCHLVGALAVFLVVLAAGWPGGFLRGGWVQLILHRSYLVATMLRQGPSWLSVWASTDPAWAFLSIAGCAACAWWAIRECCWSVWGPLGWLAVVTVAGLSANPFRNPAHGIWLMALLSLPLGYTVTRLFRAPPPARVLAVGLVALMAASQTAHTARALRADDGKRLLRYVAEAIPPNATILADGAHIYRHYFPERRFVDLTFFEGSRGLRQAGRFTPETSSRLRETLDVRDGIREGRYDYVILQPGREALDPDLARLLQERYRLVPETSSPELMYHLVGGAEPQRHG
ncbi:MAG: glycosyltransferase family 39 protein [Candidatus Omnitrophica bacterium]|nr:glycosyltransferase family 39 protein [Candidatus Omnitrophota bacterium]